MLIYYLRLIAPEWMYIYVNGVEEPDPWYNGPDLIVLADVLRLVGGGRGMQSGSQLCETLHVRRVGHVMLGGRRGPGKKKVGCKTLVGPQQGGSH